MISNKIVNLISINDENLQIFNAGLEPQNEFAGRLENCHCQVSVAFVHALFYIKLHHGICMGSSHANQTVTPIEVHAIQRRQ